MTESGPLRALYLLYSHYESDPRPRRMAQVLQRAGWDVTVLGLGIPEAPEPHDVEGVHVVPFLLPRYRGGSVSGYLRGYVRFAAWAFRWTASHRREFDFVHVHAPPDFLAFAALPARWSGAGTLLDVHDPTPELFAERFQDRHRWVVAAAKRIERMSTAVVDRVLTVNAQVVKRLVGRGLREDRISVVMNLPEEGVFWRDEIPAPPPEPVLAYHGTLVPHLGPQYLLEAAAILAPDYPGLRVRIIGDGDMREALAARAARPDLAGRVTISPRRVPVAEIPEALGPVTAGVVANQIGGYPDIILPTKLLEYMALGIPAVVTRTETVKHYFPDDCLITVSRPDPREIADALRPLLDDPATGRANVLRAREFFTRHSWRKSGPEYVALAESLAKRGRRRPGDSPPPGLE